MPRETTSGVIGGYNSMLSRFHTFRLSILLFLSCCLLFTACGQNTATTPGSQAKPTPTVALDYYGTPIAFPATPPQRIISLLPSTSEILGALHLQSRVVGVDYYTSYPTDLASMTKVSDANGKYNIEQIVALKPDLVLSYGGETKDTDAQLENLGMHIVDLPLSNFSQSLQQILLIGRLTSTENTAESVVNQLQQQIKQIKAAVAGTIAPTVLLEVDDSTPGKPYVFGAGSFGNELLQDANGINIFQNNSSNGGYPQVTDEAIIAANPQYIILTEDPSYGGNPALVYQRPNWNNIDAVKLHHVYRINVNIMQHPGPRLVEGLRCVAQIIHPDKFTGSLPSYCSGTV
ncbi:MAG TPA: ABC transporter substrate-binding protein [Ktedonobacteraceae bacterium]|nr:ABC transporter substrate-binding protein [Ktedonobacteraceae bacterium]